MATNKLNAKFAARYNQREKKTEIPATENPTPASSRLFDLNIGEEIIKIDIRDIIPNPKNIRIGQIDTTSEDFLGLMENIELIGLQQNLVVRKTRPEDQCHAAYMLISGHRRFEALKRLHEKHPQDLRFTYINCLIGSYEKDIALTPEVAEEMAIVSTNVEMRPLTNAEQIAAVRTYEKAYKQISDKVKTIKKEKLDCESEESKKPLTQAEERLIGILNDTPYKRDFIAGSLKISPRKVSYLKRIDNDLIEPFKTAFMQDQFSTEAAMVLAAQSAEIQEAFLKQWSQSLIEVTRADVDGFILTACDKNRIKKSNRTTKAAEVQHPEKQNSITIPEPQTINLKKELLQIMKGIDNEEQMISGEDYQKLKLSLKKIEKEMKKILKLTNTENN